MSDEDLRGLSTPELLHRVMEEARELVSAEIEHAKAELRLEARRALWSAIFFALAGVLALWALSALWVALGLALPLGRAEGPALVGVLLLALAAGCVWAGVRQLPKRPLNRTVEHARKDLGLLKEVRG